METLGGVLQRGKARSGGGNLGVSPAHAVSILDCPTPARPVCASVDRSALFPLREKLSFQQLLALIGITLSVRPRFNVRPLLLLTSQIFPS